MTFLTNIVPEKVYILTRLAALPSVNITLFFTKSKNGLDGNPLPELVGVYTSDDVTTAKKIRFWNAYSMFCRELMTRGIDVDDFCCRIGSRADNNRGG